MPIDLKHILENDNPHVQEPKKRVAAHFQGDASHMATVCAAYTLTSHWVTATDYIYHKVQSLLCNPPFNSRWNRYGWFLVKKITNSRSQDAEMIKTLLKARSGTVTKGRHWLVWHRKQWGSGMLWDLTTHGPSWITLTVLPLTFCPFSLIQPTIWHPAIRPRSWSALSQLTSFGN